MQTSFKLDEATPVGQTEFSFSNKKHLYVESRLFNQVYIFNDLPREKKEMWQDEGSVPFQEFCEQFRNLCETLDSDVNNFESWSERDTLENLIKPVLRCLGYVAPGGQDPWGEDQSFTVRDSGETKVWRPDLIIVRDPKELKHIRTKEGYDKLEEARSSVQFPLEAKYWGRIEEREKGISESSRNDKKAKNESSKSMEFDEQCLKYMSILGKQYGVLTDGKIWRIYHSELSSGTYKRFYQFKLGSLIRLVQRGFGDTPKAYEEFVEAAKYFYFFFSPAALCPTEEDGSVLDELVEHSKRYATSFQEDLKLRFVNAMKIACNGFEGSKKFSDEQVCVARSVAESHLFNVLLMRYCESTSILPIQNAKYFEISITGLLDKLKHYNPEKEQDGLNKPFLDRFFKSYYDIKYNPNGTELYKSLLKLTRIVQNGIKGSEQGFEIKGFRESLFSKEEWDFATDRPISNQAMIAIFFELGYVKNGTKFQQIPYNYFSPRQLGSIYESFLEFRLERATENLVYVKKSKKWESGNPDSDKVRERGDLCVRKGELFFAPNNSERKDTGSYYTPDCVVRYIVSETLSPLIRGKKAAEIKKIRVCDPAMGSGHFLGSALNYLADAYYEALDAETNDDLSISKLDAKQEILHECIFGVDLNPRAVKLAKMSLWLETADPYRMLEPLDDQLKCANSLTNIDLWKKEWKFLASGIDAVVGNPPYLGEKGHKEIFQDVANGWLGKYYLGKMDLFYFFFHLGVEILKQNGRLGFITTNYFTTAQGAKKLRYDLCERTNIDLLINLNELKVFGEAAGQHNMITVLTKTELAGNCTVVSSTETGLVNELQLQKIVSTNCENSKISYPAKKDLYDGIEKYIRLQQDNGNVKSGVESILNKIAADVFRLSEVCNVNNGVFTGCDSIKEKNITKYKLKNVKDGDGVFVLSNDEIRSLRLSKHENKLIMPLYKNSDIFKFKTNVKNSLNLINFRYTDRPILNEFPKLKEHIERFKPVLASRPQTGTLQSAFKNNLWHVMSTSRKLDFDGPKIVCPQRSKTNTFGYNDITWYAASDVFFITASENTNYDLKYLLGILNSKLIYFWLYHRGKRKGEMLELIGNPVSEIPIKDANIKVQEAVVAITNKLIDTPSSSVDFDKLNTLVYELYGLSKIEISVVEKFYSLKNLESNERIAA